MLSTAEVLLKVQSTSTHPGFLNRRQMYASAINDPFDAAPKIYAGVERSANTCTLGRQFAQILRVPVKADILHIGIDNALCDRTGDGLRHDTTVDRLNWANAKACRRNETLLGVIGVEKVNIRLFVGDAELTGQFAHDGT